MVRMHIVQSIGGVREEEAGNLRGRRYVRWNRGGYGIGGKEL